MSLRSRYRALDPDLALNRNLVSGWNLLYPVRDVAVDHGDLRALCQQDMSAPLLTRPACAIFPTSMSIDVALSENLSN